MIALPPRRSVVDAAVLLDRVRAAIRARHYSRRTEEAYVAWRYIFFHGRRHPAEMGAPEITRFLSSLAVDGQVAASTQLPASTRPTAQERNLMNILFHGVLTFAASSFIFMTAASSYGANRCQMPSVYPYPDTSTYRGINANREGNHVVPCTAASTYALDYLALPRGASGGHMIMQPPTFSADGQKLYQTTLDFDSCNLFEVTLATGTSRCLNTYNIAIAVSSVEVDAGGNLYFTTGHDALRALSQVHSLDANGNPRWAVTLSHPFAVGLRFTPQGDIALITADGVVMLLSRHDGHPLSFPLDIPRALGLVPAPERPPGLWSGVRGLLQFRRALVNAIGAIPIHEGLEFLATWTNSYVNNTLAVTRNNQLISTLSSADGVRIVGVNVNPSTRELSLAWSAQLQGTHSNSSPAVTSDGRYVAVADSSQGLYLIDALACTRSPDTCAPAWRYAMPGSLGGSPAIDDSPTIYAYIVPEDVMDPTVPDLFALGTVEGADGKQAPQELWTLTFPGVTQWTSAVAVFRNYLVGGITSFQLDDSGTAKPVQHQLVAVDYKSGSPGKPPAILWQLPADSDAVNDVVLGPDGAIYLPYMGLFDLWAGRPWTGGVRRYAPTSP